MAHHDRARAHQQELGINKLGHRKHFLKEQARLLGDPSSIASQPVLPKNIGRGADVLVLFDVPPSRDGFDNSSVAYARPISQLEFAFNETAMTDGLNVIIDNGSHMSPATKVSKPRRPRSAVAALLEARALARRRYCRRISCCSCFKEPADVHRGSPLGPGLFLLCRPR